MTSPEKEAPSDGTEGTLSLAEPSGQNLPACLPRVSAAKVRGSRPSRPVGEVVTERTKHCHAALSGLDRRELRNHAPGLSLLKRRLAKWYLVVLMVKCPVYN